QALDHEFARMQEEAEAFRQDVERMREQAERDVLVRLQGPDVIAPAAPLAPPVPAAPPTPPQPMTLTMPGMPGVPELIPTPEAPPMPPPWRFWVETDDDDTPAETDAATGEAVVGRVREAVVAGLEAHRGPLTLPPQEFVVAVVDFLSRDPARRRVARTLQVRVRAGDLAERRAGRLTPAD